jgi:hypothetical protein
VFSLNANPLVPVASLQPRVSVSTVNEGSQGPGLGAVVAVVLGVVLGSLGLIVGLVALWVRRGRYVAFDLVVVHCFWPVVGIPRACATSGVVVLPAPPPRVSPCLDPRLRVPPVLCDCVGCVHADWEPVLPRVTRATRPGLLVGPSWYGNPTRWELSPLRHSHTMRG